MSVLRRLLERPVEERAIDSGSWGAAWGDIAAPTHSGQVVTRESSLGLLTVYGCVKFITDGIATLPLHEFRDGAEVPTSPWLSQPTPDLDRVAWLSQVLTSLLLDGNAYLYVDRAAGRVASVLPLDPKIVKVVRSGGRKRFELAGRPADALEIIHIPGLILAGSDVGLSPVEMARQTLGGALGADEYSNRWFAQGMSSPGVIETDGVLTADQARDLARAAAKMHGGAGKAGLPMVLSQAKWKPIAITADQAQFLETRKFTAAQIASMMFNVDPADIGLGVDGSSLTYANLEQRNTRRVQVTYLPWIVRLEHALAKISVTTQPKFNLDGILRADLKTRYESYATALDKTFLTLDEIRAFEDLPPMPANPEKPPALIDQIEAVGQLIRAGFEPAAALAAVGMPPIEHTGLVPVTVKSEDAPTPGVGV